MGVLGVIFIIFASVYGLLSIYVKILIRDKGFSITFLYTEISDYKALYEIGKRNKNFNTLFWLYIGATIAPILVMLIILCTIM
jgi:hypothetical protein